MRRRKLRERKKVRRNGDKGGEGKEGGKREIGKENGEGKGEMGRENGTSIEKWVRKKGEGQEGRKQGIPPPSYLGDPCTVILVNASPHQ